MKLSLYTKAKDSYLYLRSSSCHPPHTLRGIPRVLTTRISSSNEILKNRAKYLNSIGIVDAIKPTKCDLQLMSLLLQNKKILLQP